MIQSILKILMTLFIVSGATLCVIKDSFATSKVSISIKVIDEKGNTVEGARVGVGFTEHLVWDSKEIPVVGFTDVNGLFTASATADGDLGFNVTKDGYYQSFGSKKFKAIRNSRWEPWNPEVNVVLRKIENPVPMYLRDTHNTGGLVIPALGVEIGFDLIEYDWMPPYGKGKATDFIFKVDKRYTDDKDFDCTLTITFPNKFDGIQSYPFDRREGSVLKLSRYAPEGGYQPKYIGTVFRKPGGSLVESYKDDNNYYFRVRSEEKDGKLERAMYGKIHGDFAIGARSAKTANIVFKYFLNPDYARNLEFGENLFDFKGMNVGIE